jgi:hypothetical protein
MCAASEAKDLKNDEPSEIRPPRSNKKSLNYIHFFSVSSFFLLFLFQNACRRRRRHRGILKNNL